MSNSTNRLVLASRSHCEVGLPYREREILWDRIPLMNNKRWLIGVAISTQPWLEKDSHRRGYDDFQSINQSINQSIQCKADVFLHDCGARLSEGEGIPRPSIHLTPECILQSTCGLLVLDRTHQSKPHWILFLFWLSWPLSVVPGAGSGPELPGTGTGTEPPKLSPEASIDGSFCRRWNPNGIHELSIFQSV